MAKVSKKKASKKGVKKSKKTATAPDHVAVVNADVVYDEEDEEDLNKKDEDVTSDEEDEENGGEDERRRQKLLEAISALGGRRKRKLGERSEAAVQMSEFTVNAEGEGHKLDLAELIGTVEETPAVPAKTKKQLKNLQQSKKTIECPLSKQESERIQRDVAFQKASAEVSRWKGVIGQNQRAEQLVFPLNQEPPGPKPMERVVTGWKAQTPLELEVFALLSANKQPLHDPVLTPAEEASLKAMSLEEAKIRRAELQKARALQSYYEAKARRERKIKSKKYHKVQNKGKRKEFVKQFEEMAKTDPVAALEELNKMELARMKERMSLKHQNSGKWAKSKAVMAKYDEGARKAMQQQLEVNKDLTQKLATSLANEDEEEEEPDAEVLPDFVNDAEERLVSSNPWMSGKLSEYVKEKEVIVDHKTEETEAACSAEEEEGEEKAAATEEENLLREFDSRRKLRQAEEARTGSGICVEDESDDEEERKDAAGVPEEEEELAEFASLFRGLTDSRREAAAERSEEGGSREDTGLEEGLTRIRTLEDVELLGHEESAGVEAPAQVNAAQVSAAPRTTEESRKGKRRSGVELEEVLTKQSKVIRVPLAPTVADSEDAEEKLDQRGLVQEAFAGDDVVSDFLNDKTRQEEAGKPKVEDLTLPGWGEWGGTGLQPSRSKRRRFRTKRASAPPRKDQHLPSVIISEKRNGSIGLHQVNSLPFPFDTPSQFESTVRSPLGRTWNTERTVKKATRPRVVTQLGAIIEPMAREELMKDRKQESAGSEGGKRNKIKN